MSFGVGGVAPAVVALSIGLFNSIMFPVIFTLTLERSTASDEATSGFLCFCDRWRRRLSRRWSAWSRSTTSYVTAFIVPAACYAVLCAFALAAHRARVQLRDEPAVATIH